MATYEDIVYYLLSITDAQSDYGKKVAKDFIIGRPNMKVELIKLTLLGYYIRALEKYFDTPDYTVNNFLTVAEAKDIMERINKICSRYIYLDI